MLYEESQSSTTRRTLSASARLMRWLHVDGPLLAALARRLPGQSFIVIGHSPPQELARVPNCHLLGSFPYHRIPGFVAHFDVAIMPHKVDAYNRSANPLKLLQYLAAGKPIVSTAVPNTEDYPGLVRTAAGAEEFTLAR